MRAANETYLAAHPELQTLVSLFMKGVLEAKPKDPMAFACKVCTHTRVCQICTSWGGGVGVRLQGTQLISRCVCPALEQNTT